MTDAANNQVPSWPKELPPPVSVTMLPKELPIYREELINDKDINELIHDLFYFPEEKYFLYFKYEEDVIPDGFDFEKLQDLGLFFEKYENFYYRRPFHPSTPEKYTYIQIISGDAKTPWQVELVENTPMYSRVQIELMEWLKKDIEMARIKAAADKKQNAIILQPNFYGIGLDINSIISSVRRFFKKEK